MGTGYPDPGLPGGPPDKVAARIPMLETGWEQDHGTGDWGGFRTWCVDRGVHLSAAYAAEVFANLAGGLRQAAIYEGLFEVSLDIDPSKFSSWTGMTFHVSSLYPHGSGPTDKLAGDISTVSNIDAEDAWVLYELWLEQSAWNGGVSLRLGQLAADEEFSVTEYGGLFINSTFGWPAYNGVNAPTPAFALAAPGARLRLTPCERFFVHAGIYDGNPDPGRAEGHRDNKHGTRIGLSREEGAFFIGELVFRSYPSQPRSGLPGTYKIGAWHHTGDFPSQRRDNRGVLLSDPLSTAIPRQEDGNWAIYFIGDQMLWREPDGDQAEDTNQGLGLFLRAAANPSDRNVLESYLDGGLTYQGLIPGRDQDQAGIAFAWLNISGDARRTARRLGAVMADQEMVLEGTYRIQLAPWWILQPDVQYIIHPGGSDAVADALLLGLRSGFVF